MAHRDACVFTLTYSDEFLPSDGLLHYEDVQLWLKRLRRAVNVPIKFFCAGEYGSRFGRPHWHVIIFGWRPDMSLRRFRLSQCFQWHKGYSFFDDFSGKSCGYVSSYVGKDQVLQRMSQGLGYEYYKMLGRVPSIQIGNWRYPVTDTVSRKMLEWSGEPMDFFSKRERAISVSLHSLQFMTDLEPNAWIVPPGGFLCMSIRAVKKGMMHASYYKSKTDPPEGHDLVWRQDYAPDAEFSGNSDCPF